MIVIDNDDWKLLTKLINTKLIIKPKKKAVSLTDPQNNNSSKVTIHNLPDKVVIFKLDAVFDQSKFLDCSSQEGVCALADYALLHYSKKGITCVILELKEGNPKGSNHILNQLIGGKCVVSYLQFVCNNFCPLKNQIEISFSLVAIKRTKTKAKKRSTSLKPQNKTGTEEFKKLTGSEHHFDKLIY